MSSLLVILAANEGTEKGEGCACTNIIETQGGGKGCVGGRGHTWSSLW